MLPGKPRNVPFFLGNWIDGFGGFHKLRVKLTNRNDCFPGNHHCPFNSPLIRPEFLGGVGEPLFSSSTWSLKLRNPWPMCQFLGRF